MSPPPSTLIPIKFHRQSSHPSQASSSSSSPSTLRGVPHCGLGERSLKRLLDERSRSIVNAGKRSGLTTTLHEKVEGGGDVVMSGEGEGLKPIELSTASRTTRELGDEKRTNKRKSQAIMSPSPFPISGSISPRSTSSTKPNHNHNQRNGINWSLILSGCTPSALLQSKGWKGEGNHRSDVEWVSKDVRRARERERLGLELAMAMEARATTSKQLIKQPPLKRGRQPGQPGKGRRFNQPSPSSIPPPSRGRSRNVNGQSQVAIIAAGGTSTPRMGLRSPRSPASSRESSPAVALASVAPHPASDAETGGGFGTAAARSKSGGRDGVLPPPSPLRASAVPRFASAMGEKSDVWDEGGGGGVGRKKRSRSEDSDEDGRELKRTESGDVTSTRASTSPEKKSVVFKSSSERKEIGRSNSHPIIKPLDDALPTTLPSHIPIRRTLSHDDVPSSVPSVSSSAGSVGLFEHPSIGMVRSGSGRSRRETTMPRALKDYDTKITA